MFKSNVDRANQQIKGTETMLKNVTILWMMKATNCTNIKMQRCMNYFSLYFSKYKTHKKIFPIT